MKLIPLFFLFTLATAAAEVPSLINYQGRLVGADGAAQSGQKTFLLEVFEAASGGSLLYREEIGAITLGEGGVYSFQFGGSGTSNAQITETIGTGGEAVLYQQVLSNLPVVAGSVSVSDGTYTWSQENGSSNEDDFSAAFSTNLNRITVNYFSGAPNDGRSIDVTYRYESEGITGALSSGGEHWLQLTIDGDVQATRERVLAVPFALRAGALVGEQGSKVHRYTSKRLIPSNARENWNHAQQATFGGQGGNYSSVFSLPRNCRQITNFTGQFWLFDRAHRFEFEVFQTDPTTGLGTVVDSQTLDWVRDDAEVDFLTLRFPGKIEVDPSKHNYICITNSSGRTLGGLSLVRATMQGLPQLTYEE